MRRYLIIAWAWALPALAQEGEGEFVPMQPPPPLAIPVERSTLEEGLLVEALVGPRGVYVHIVDANRLQAVEREVVGYHVYRSSFSAEFELPEGEGEEPPPPPGSDPLPLDLARLTDAPYGPATNLPELARRLGADGSGRDLEGILARLQTLSASQRMIAAGFDPYLGFATGFVYVDEIDPEQLAIALYHVTRVYADGGESARSNYAEVTHAEQLAPVSQLRAASADGQVDLSWVDDQDGVFYEVYRGERAEGPFALVSAPLLPTGSAGEASVQSFADTTVVNGRSYHYFAVARDFAENLGARGQLVEVTPLDENPPAVPAGLHFRSGTRGVVLTWTANGEADLAGYKVLRHTNPQPVMYQRVNGELVPATPDSASFEDVEVLSNTTYYYWVQAVDRAGNESELSSKITAVYENVEPPLPPLGLAAEGDDDGVRLSWEPSPEPDVVGYMVHRRVGRDGPMAQISPRLTETAFYDRSKDLAPGSTYWYAVQAINLLDAPSALSPAVAAGLTRLPQPEPPLSVHGFTEADGHRIFWNAPLDESVVGYIVYCRVEGGDPEEWTKLHEAPIPAVSRTYTIKDVAQGLTCSYHVRSVNEAGVESAASVSATLTIQIPLPNPPGNLAAAAGDTGVILTWDPSRESQAAGYVVYRRADTDDGPPAPMTAEPLGLQQTRYIDAGAEVGIRYFYSVSCLGSDGREGERSLEVPYYLYGE